MEGEDDPERGGCPETCPHSQSPFSHFRVRAAYLRKSVSADDHLDLGSDYSSGTVVDGKPSRGSKGKLKRKFVSYLCSSASCYLTSLHCRTNLTFHAEVVFRGW